MNSDLFQSVYIQTTTKRNPTALNCINNNQSSNRPSLFRKKDFKRPLVKIEKDI